MQDKTLDTAINMEDEHDDAEEEVEEERGTPGKGFGCPLSPSLYIGVRGWRRRPRVP